MNDVLQNILRRTQTSAVGFNPAAQDQESYYTEVVQVNPNLEETPPPSPAIDTELSEQRNIVTPLESTEADALITSLLSGQDEGIPQIAESENPAIEATRIVDEAMEELGLQSPEAPVLENPSDNEEQKASDYFIENETIRFSSAEWFKKTQEQTVLIAGVGGIGSWCSFLIAKLHPSIIYLYDMDTVERENLAGQLYRKTDYGRPKVFALADTIEDYTGFKNVYTFNQEYTADSPFEKVMICGFDNMNARKTFFNRWKFGVDSFPEEKRNECLFIDGRLTANELQIFCIVGDDTYSMNKYETEYLFSDDEASSEICSFKQTAYMANIIGGLITNLFVNFCANLCNPVMPKMLPFKTAYISEYMFFKLEN